MTGAQASNREATLVVATSNPGKLRELATILPASTKLLSLRDLDIEGPEETGRTFLDNAVLKAQHACMESGLPAIADDSGLDVDALGGRPGIKSARFAGRSASDQQNNIKLIEELQASNAADRSAHFRCAVAFCTPDGFQLKAVGSLSGRIIDEARGTSGFGYDPHFEIDDPDATSFAGKTVAELSLSEKNSISHRSRAYQNLVNEIRSGSYQHPSLHMLLDE